MLKFALALLAFGLVTTTTNAQNTEAIYRNQYVNCFVATDHQGVFTDEIDTSLVCMNDTNNLLSFTVNMTESSISLLNIASARETLRERVRIRIDRNEIRIVTGSLFSGYLSIEGDGTIELMEEILTEMSTAQQIAIGVPGTIVVIPLDPETIGNAIADFRQRAGISQQSNVLNSSDGIATTNLQTQNTTIEERIDQLVLENFINAYDHESEHIIDEMVEYVIDPLISNAILKILPEPLQGLSELIDDSIIEELDRMNFEQRKEIYEILNNNVNELIEDL